MYEFELRGLSLGGAGIVKLRWVYFCVYVHQRLRGREGLSAATRFRLLPLCGWESEFPRVWAWGFGHPGGFLCCVSYFPPLVVSFEGYGEGKILAGFLGVLLFGYECYARRALAEDNLT